MLATSRVIWKFPQLFPAGEAGAISARDFDCAVISKFYSRLLLEHRVGSDMIGARAHFTQCATEPRIDRESHPSDFHADFKSDFVMP